MLGWKTLLEYQGPAGISIGAEGLCHSTATCNDISRTADDAIINMRARAVKDQHAFVINGRAGIDRTRGPPLPSCNVPWLISVMPEYVLSLARITKPVPSFGEHATPLMTPEWSGCRCD